MKPVINEEPLDSTVIIFVEEDDVTEDVVCEKEVYDKAEDFSYWKSLDDAEEAGSITRQLFTVFTERKLTGGTFTT